MSTPSTARAEEIFILAQELEADDREAFVREACAGDDPLRREVDALLAAAGHSDGFFADLADRLGAAALLDEALQAHAQGEPGGWTGGRPGQTVGQYTLTARIGAGGMGAVWHAERSDGRFEGQVAIKLLAAGGVAAQRFELEGRYLARLSHPKIARLIDAGVTPDARPYLVLEYIDGAPIDRYCDERRLDVRSRIRLFLDVLDGVAHAHARLIVHRDIKPSNVLVADDGTVKLLDFGIAKLLRAEEGTTAAGVTREFGAALTPEFAAPEQLIGGEVTTATDIYSLGVLLYLLLAGCHPRPPADVDSLAGLQLAARQDPPKLSRAFTGRQTSSSPQARASAADRRSTPAALRRLLRGDLDNIVRRALAVEASERYGTVAAFSADLRRYLANEPVSARPATIGYRVNRFVRRHRASVLAASLVGIALIAATVVTAWQSVEARRQRDAAIDQQQRVQASNEFLTLLLEEIGPDGEALTVVELLDRGVAMIDRYGEQPFVGRMLYNIAQRYAALGAVDRTLELLGRAEAKARIHGDFELLAAVLCAQTRAQLVGDPAGSRARFAEATELLARLDEPVIDTVVSCARADAAIVELQGDRSRAIDLLAATRRTLEASTAASTHLRGVLLNDLSNLYFKTDHLDKALELSDEILALEAGFDRSDTLGYLILLLNRAAIFHNLGEISTAMTIREQALERVRQLEEAGRGPVGFWEAYASGLMRLGRFEETLQLAGENRARAQALGNVAAIARSDLLMGRTLMHMGRHQEAAAYLDAAVAVFDEAPGTNSRLLHLVALARAQIQLAGGDAAGGRAAIESLLAQLGYPDDRTGPGLKNALRVAAHIALLSGDAAAAERFATDFHAISVTVARDPRLSADVGQALLLRAKARLARGDPKSAGADLRSALEPLTNGFGPQHPDTLETQALLAGLPEAVVSGTEPYAGEGQ